ncbi:Uncharacterized protein Rs2_45925 [Raphanus sativus]|nr:Uncharacterized protein Rs2_45925 [Raphanus sativus]
MALMVTAPPSRFRPPPDPPPRKSTPLKAPSPIVPPEPPDPPDVSSLLALPRSPISFSVHSPQDLTRILDLKPPLPWMVSKISGGGVPLVSTGGSTFVYGRLFCAVCRSFSCGHMDGSSISSGSDLSNLTFMGFQLFVCVTLELRTIALAGDVLTDLIYVGSTIVLFDDLYVALVRSLTAVCRLTVVCSLLTAVCSFLTAVCRLTAVCSLLTAVCSLTVFILAFGLVCWYFSFWWQLKEKFIAIVSWMNMIMAGTGYPFVSCLEHLLFPICPLVWSDLDLQASLVLQGSSSHRVLSSASGAVCVVLWVTLDAIFQEAYETVDLVIHECSGIGFEISPQPPPQLPQFPNRGLHTVFTRNGQAADFTTI